MDEGYRRVRRTSLTLRKGVVVYTAAPLFFARRILNLMRITIMNLAPSMATLAVHHSLLFALNLSRLDEHASLINHPKSRRLFSRDKDVCRWMNIGCLAFHSY